MLYFIITIMFILSKLVVLFKPENKRIIIQIMTLTIFGPRNVCKHSPDCFILGLNDSKSWRFALTFIDKWLVRKATRRTRID